MAIVTHGDGLHFLAEQSIMPPELVGYPFGEFASFGGMEWVKGLITNEYDRHRKGVSDPTGFANISDINQDFRTFGEWGFRAVEANTRRPEGAGGRSSRGILVPGQELV